jgi:hypothetical protein
MSTGRPSGRFVVKPERLLGSHAVAEDERQVTLRTIDGEQYTKTVPEADADACLHQVLQDPGKWISIDDETHIQKAHVVAFQLRSAQQPLVDYG